MSSESKEGIETSNNSGINISKWAYAAIIIGGIVAYYLSVPGKEETIEKCISNYAADIAKKNANLKISSEVLGHSDIVILTSPENSGYYVLDFNVRLLIKSNMEKHSKQENIPVKGFKCFYDRSKYIKWKQENNS